MEYPLWTSSPVFLSGDAGGNGIWELIFIASLRFPNNNISLRRTQWFRTDMEYSVGVNLVDGKDLLFDRFLVTAQSTRHLS